MSFKTLKRLYTGAAFIATIAITAFQTSAQAQTPISTAAELSAVRNNPSGEYYLVNNIDMSTLPAGAAFEPIGNYQTPFIGELDGRGFEVRNLRVSKRNVTDGRVGLFGQIGPGGRVRNLGVSGASVVGGFAVGALAGANNGVVTNCYSTGKVEAVRGQESNAGGLVGHNGGTIERSRSSATVIGGDNVGGLVGFLTIVNNRGEIKDCNASGDVEGNNNVGGLVGYIFGGKVEKSYSITRLSKSRTAAQSARHGGLVGTEFFDGRASNNTVGRMPDGGFVKPADIFNSFWDIDVAGVGNTSSGGGSQMGVTSADMTNPNTFTDKGWEVITAVDPANPGAAEGKWVISGDGNSVPQLVTVVKDNNNAVTNVTEIHTVTYAIDAPTAAQGSVTVNGTPLTTEQSVSTSAATASVGAVVVATPKPGYEFVAWTVDGNVVSTDSVLAYVAEGNAVITPVFRPIVAQTQTRNVQFSVYDGIGGSVSVSGNLPFCPTAEPCEARVVSGLGLSTFGFAVNSEIIVTATPSDSTLEFAGWVRAEENSFVVESTDNPRTVTIGEDLNLVARFRKIDPCDYAETATPNCQSYCIFFPDDPQHCAIVVDSTYTVTFGTSAGGHIVLCSNETCASEAPAASGKFTKDTTIYIKGVANDGYTISGSNVSGWNGSEVHALIVNSNKVIQVTFTSTNGDVVIPPADITVSKPGGGGMFASIQDAVNAAQAGYIIEILDTEVYEEQVTIDGRAARTSSSDINGHPWGDGVVGGKSNITIRYLPKAGQTGRPTIKWQDITNVHPKNETEARADGDGLHESGNYEACGALRIIRTHGVTIEGITVDGGGAAPFAYAGVWRESAASTAYPLVHGNAAVTVVSSGNVQIRDSELRNAYFGLYVKDRNTGGVFANANPADNDFVLPASDFGRNGNHLFEYNKIGNNAVGLRFESSWDLGSTVRYNLIFGNYLRTPSPWSTVSFSDQDMAPGAIMLKDNYLSPLAIYNNTFFENADNIFGVWQVGAQHLIFNNIFSRKKFASTSTGSLLSPATDFSYVSMDGRFPNRMKHNVFAADHYISVQSQQSVGYVVSGVGFRAFGGLAGTGTPPMLSAGTVISSIVGSGSTIPFASDANNRWLETVGGVPGASTPASLLPNLFKSTDPASPDFLVPKYDDTDSTVNHLVTTYIMNGGWSESGIAHIGAIPHSGKRPGDGVRLPSRLRITPTSVVRIMQQSGTPSATVSFNISDEVASSVSGLSRSYGSWIAPIPDSTGRGANDCIPIPTSSIHPNVGPDVSFGSNNRTFAIQRVPTTDYGFLEMIVTGTVDGKTVISDVGFLPYRKIPNYTLDIQILRGTTPVNTVTAGEEVTLRVRALADGVVLSKNGNSFAVEYESMMSSTPSMFLSTGVPLTSDPDFGSGTGTTYTKDYTVYFTNAGDEMIMAAGVWSGMPFMGMAMITVEPGAASAPTDTETAPDVQPAPPSSELSIGPNPVSVNTNGEVALYWDGGAIKSASLYVYSSTGERVGKLSVKDPSSTAALGKRGVSSDNIGRRRIGEWKMRDKRSRPVASGTYLIRGVVKTVDGKRERVSVVVGVR